MLLGLLSQAPGYTKEAEEAKEGDSTTSSSSVEEIAPPRQSARHVVARATKQVKTKRPPEQKAVQARSKRAKTTTPKRPARSTAPKRPAPSTASKRPSKRSAPASKRLVKKAPLRPASPSPPTPSPLTSKEEASPQIPIQWRMLNCEVNEDKNLLHESLDTRQLNRIGYPIISTYKSRVYTIYQAREVLRRFRRAGAVSIASYEKMAKGTELVTYLHSYQDGEAVRRGLEYLYK